MGSDIPKQFLLLDGKPVLMHTIRAFGLAVPEASIVVAIPASFFDRWEELRVGYGPDLAHQVVAGGETRFHSVKNALLTLPNEGLVAVHDGARPLVSSELIVRSFASAELADNAVPTVPVRESLREKMIGGNRPVDRSLFRLVQTPQVFQLADLQSAYRQPYRPEFTDDATVMESAGFSINLIDGETWNLKITTPEDMVIAQALMTRSFQR